MEELTDEMKEMLTDASAQMSRAAALIKEGEDIKKTVKELILPIMSAHDLKSFGSDMGTLSCPSGFGSAIDATKLATVLLDRGIEADQIPAIIEKATKRWFYTYVAFKAATTKS